MELAQIRGWFPIRDAHKIFGAHVRIQTCWYRFVAGIATSWSSHSDPQLSETWKSVGLDPLGCAWQSRTVAGNLQGCRRKYRPSARVSSLLLSSSVEVKPQAHQFVMPQFSLSSPNFSWSSMMGCRNKNCEKFSKISPHVSGGRACRFYRPMDVGSPPWLPRVQHVLPMKSRLHNWHGTPNSWRAWRITSFVCTSH